MSQQPAPALTVKPDMFALAPSAWPHPRRWPKDMAVEEVDRKVKLYMEARGMIVCGPNGEVYTSSDIEMVTDKNDTKIFCTQPRPASPGTVPVVFQQPEFGYFSLAALAATTDTFNQLSDDIEQLDIDVQADLTKKPLLDQKQKQYDQIVELSTRGHDKHPFVPYAQLKEHWILPLWSTWAQVEDDEKVIEHNKTYTFVREDGQEGDDMALTIDVKLSAESLERLSRDRQYEYCP